MELLIEIIFEFLAEVVLQVLMEALVEFGMQSFTATSRKPKPWLAALGYSLSGAIAGTISLWLFPKHFFTSDFGRITGLILVPVAAGASMAAIGAWRRNQGQELIQLDRFTYGYLFAMCMTLVRFHFGQ